MRRFTQRAGWIAIAVGLVIPLRPASLVLQAWRDVATAEEAIAGRTYRIAGGPLQWNSDQLSPGDAAYHHARLRFTESLTDLLVSTACGLGVVALGAIALVTVRRDPRADDGEEQEPRLLSET